MENLYEKEFVKAKLMSVFGEYMHTLANFFSVYTGAVENLYPINKQAMNIAGSACLRNSTGNKRPEFADKEEIVSGKLCWATMQSLKSALENTSAHALPRTVSAKPIYIRIVWLLIFFTMLALFLTGFSDFVVKLQQNEPTSTQEVGVESFVFPDVYMCFESPISGSYSARVDAATADEINAGLNATSGAIQNYIAMLGITGEEARQTEAEFSFMYPQSLPYSLLIDALGHRAEQSVITSQITYLSNYGTALYRDLRPESFYHPKWLRCLKWALNSSMQAKILQAGKTSGIIARILIDQNFSDIYSASNRIQQKVFDQSTPIPTSDWTLGDPVGPDRSSGVRVFLAPPGQYPSDFTTSFSLSPGKHHTVEIGMTKYQYKSGQFDCLENEPPVQFLNPYDRTPYEYSYSYSYCFYYQYHKQCQTCLQLSGEISPMPWPLRGYKYVTNLTGLPNFFSVLAMNGSLGEYCDAAINQTRVNAVKACQSKRLCSDQDYSVRISSTDWPSLSSLDPFIRSFIFQSWSRAKAQNLSVPALDFLLSGSADRVVSYSNRNLLKVHFLPSKVQCDKITFSRDYGASSFISDVGGIMGIYLGMSLLTLCEVLELIYDISVNYLLKRRGE